MQHLLELRLSSRLAINLYACLLVAGMLRVTSLSHGALLSVYMCTCAANAKRNVILWMERNR